MKELDKGLQIIRIVITGGPCSGKTTAINRIMEELADGDYQILIMPETATQLIGGGISPWTCESMFSYQRWQLRMQQAKEEIYEGAAAEIAAVGGRSVLIICDRGMMDNGAYVTEGEFDELLAELKLSRQICYSWYDAVFHLETTAKGAQKYYTLDNNTSRTETLEEAALLDDQILRAWDGHPRRVILDNSTGFEEKMQRLTAGIRSFLEDVSEKI